MVVEWFLVLFFLGVAVFFVWKNVVATKTHTVLMTQYDATLAEKEAELRRAKEELIKLQAEKEKSEAILAAEVNFHKEGKALMSEHFTKLSQEALKSNQEQFFTLAKSSFERLEEKTKSELDKRRESIGQMILPIKESLQKVQENIGEVEKARLTAYTSLLEQVKTLQEGHLSLQKETGNLVQALRRPEVRGNWGEIQLRRVIEFAGMTAHCDFVEQASVETGEARLRPDVVVKLPGQRDIIIDAKAPLDAYLDSLNTDDVEEQKKHLARHARQIRDKITELSGKQYWAQFDNSPEFVILFLPNEGLFRAGVEKDPSLLEYGFEKKVILASPTNLISLLKAVAYGWNQESMTRNAEEIQKQAQELYNRTAIFVDHFAGIGDHLDKALGKYNQAVVSLESRFLPAARRMKELGVTSKSEIKTIETKTQTIRDLQAPELVNPESVASSEMEK